METITDPILPTKIIITNPPQSPELGLQNPNAASPQIPLAPPQPNAGGGVNKVGGVNFKQGQTYQRIDGLAKELERLRQEAAKADTKKQ